MTDEVNESTISEAAEVFVASDVKDHLVTLVGDDKKYKSADELAKAYVYASTHIDNLEEENKDMRVREKSLHEIIKGFRTPEDPVEQVESLPQGTDATNVIDLDQVERRVKQTLDNERAIEKANSIQEQSFAKLDEEYGSKDVGLMAVSDIIKHNPSVRTIIDSLAETDSDAFIRFIKSYNTSNVPTQIQNTPGVLNVPSADAINTSDGSLTAEHARELRKKNPKEYYSQEFQATLFASVERAMDKGQDFWAK